MDTKAWLRLFTSLQTCARFVLMRRVSVLTNAVFINELNQLMQKLDRNSPQNFE